MNHMNPGFFNHFWGKTMSRGRIWVADSHAFSSGGNHRLPKGCGASLGSSDGALPGIELAWSGNKWWFSWCQLLGINHHITVITVITGNKWCYNCYNCYPYPVWVLLSIYGYSHGQDFANRGLAKAKHGQLHGGDDHAGIWEMIGSLQAAIKEIELKHKSAQSAVREELNVLKVGRGWSIGHRHINYYGIWQCVKTLYPWWTSK